MSSRLRFRARLDADNRRWVLFLLAAAGLSHFGVSMMNVLRNAELGAFVVVAVLFAAIAPMMAVTGYLFHSHFLLLTGRWLHGKATIRDLHAAQAWSMLPLAACAPLLFANLLLAGAQGMAITAERASAFAHWNSRIDLPLYLLAGAGMIWSAIRYVIYLSEAQRFSKWLAVANQLLAAIALLATAAACIFGFRFLN